MEGRAERVRDGSKVGLTTGGYFRSGDKISASTQSRVDLMLLPGVLVELGAESEMKIERLQLTRDGDESLQPMTAREAHIRLERGRLVASVGLAPTESLLVVETPAGSFAAGPDRTLLIEVNGAKARTMCLRGKATFRPTGGAQELTIPAGFFAELPLNPGAPLRTAASAGAEVQAEVPAILNVEKRLLRLQKEHGSSFHP